LGFSKPSAEPGKSCASQATVLTLSSQKRVKTEQLEDALTKKRQRLKELKQQQAESMSGRQNSVCRY
jgi:hypothetical protein